MFPDGGLDPWVLAGLVGGGLAALAIASTFVVGERLFPAERSRSDERVESGETRRRQEIRYYLDAIDEAYEEGAEVEGHTVAFHLPDRDIAVTFDARAYLQLRDTDVYAILVEHEMPGAHLGSRLPFETPSFGTEPGGAEREGRWSGGRWTRDDGSGRGARVGDGGNRAVGHRANGNGERVGASFAMLGLQPDASEDDVRRAYRDRVKSAHPDHGGDEESFRRLQEAYDTAKEHAD